MPINKGFMICGMGGCTDVAEVLEAGGRRKTLYTKCPSCGTNQGTGVKRQEAIKNGLKVNKEELQAVVVGGDDLTVKQAEEKPAKPSKNAPSSVSDDVEIKPKEAVKNEGVKPKGLKDSPPLIMSVIALILAVISAAFAVNKSKVKG